MNKRFCYYVSALYLGISICGLIFGCTYWVTDCKAYAVLNFIESILMGFFSVRFFRLPSTCEREVAEREAAHLVTMERLLREARIHRAVATVMATQGRRGLPPTHNWIKEGF